MSTDHLKETLNGLVNELNLPQPLASTAEQTWDLRRRIAFARRIKESLVPLSETGEPASKIDVAKSYLTALRLDDDTNKLLEYLGGSERTAEDYLQDLLELGPTVRHAAVRQKSRAEILARSPEMPERLTGEEQGYLATVLGTASKTSKHFVVVAPRAYTSGLLSIPLFHHEDKYNVADAWAAALALRTSLEDTHPYISAVLPEALADRVTEVNPEAVSINATQLEPADRWDLASRLAHEVARESTTLSVALSRAFVQ